MKRETNKSKLDMKKKSVEYTLKAERKEFPVVKIRSSHDVVDFVRQFYNEDILIYESSFILLMNQANTVTGYAKISQGGICSTVVDIRLVAKYAIDSLAAAVILVHNHPSGNVRPSDEDIYLAKKMRDGLKMLEVKLLDSIVITENNFMSMNDESMLN